MPTIVVRLRIALGREHPSVPDSPVFHRWLPNGSEDAIVLQPRVGEPEDANVSDLKVWFERRGHNTTSIVRQDPDGPELPFDAIRRQSHVAGGPLISEARVVDVSDAVIATIDNTKQRAPEYDHLGQSIYRAIYAPLRSFTELLRTVYGQFWLQFPDRTHDSTEVGYFFRRASATWSVEGTNSWSRFLPGASFAIRIRMNSPSQLRRLLTEEDWRALQSNNTTSHFTAPEEANAIARAAFFLEAGDFRPAAIEAVTALEIGVESSIDSLRKTNPVFEKAYGALKQRPPIEGRLAIVAPYSRASTADVSQAFGAIHLRNRIVHEGWSPSLHEHTDVGQTLWATIRVAASLVPEPGYRVVRLPGSFTELSDEGWERAYSMGDSWGTRKSEKEKDEKEAT
jgi:hypothetical protein